MTGVLSPTNRYWCPWLHQDIPSNLNELVVWFILNRIFCCSVFFAMADVTAEEAELEEKASSFSSISEDILINIFSKLEEDPRHLASLACVCPRFNSIIRSVCWKRKCMSIIPAVVADLLQTNGRADRSAEPPGGWSSLQKLAVCCPGLWHAGILLENSDLGLERVIGPSHQYQVETRLPTASTSTSCSEGPSESYSAYPWTIFDDINFHVEYEAERLGFTANPREEGFTGIGNRGFPENPNGNLVHNSNRAPDRDIDNGAGENPNQHIADKPNRVIENPIGEMGEGFEAKPGAVMENPIGEIEDNADPVGGTENPNGENRNIANKLNRVAENSVGEMGDGITQNPNEYIPDRPTRDAENPIAEMGESCKGNPCAVTEYPNGKIAYNADLVGVTDNSNGGNGNIAKNLNRVAENRFEEMGNEITRDPNGQISDKSNRIAEDSIGEMRESGKSNPCAVTECPNGKIAANADPIGETAVNAEPIGGVENPNGVNKNIANKLNRVSQNLIEEMGSGITQYSNGQIPEKLNRAAGNPIGEMGESCKVNPCAVTECFNGEISDNANPNGKIAGFEGKTSEFSKFHDNPSGAADNPHQVICNSSDPIELKRKENPSYDQAGDHEYCDAKKQKKRNLSDPHLANEIWNLTREQGNKLLASRFRSDSLYICDWPGCVHSEEKRNYRLFRGIFKNFRNSYVWRNIRDMKAKKSLVNCAFCSSPGTWDMLATFCLRRSFEYHDDGEPSVRAYVCENGHVAGAWTDRPMYK